MKTIHIFALAAVAYLLSACTETSRNEGSWVTRAEMETRLAKLQKDLKQIEKFQSTADETELVYRELKLEFANLKALGSLEKEFRRTLENIFKDYDGGKWRDFDSERTGPNLHTYVFKNPWGFEKSDVEEFKKRVNKEISGGIRGEFHRFSFQAPVTQTNDPKPLSFKKETLRYNTVSGSAASKLGDDCWLDFAVQLTSEARGGEPWVYIPEKGVMEKIKGGKIPFKVKGMVREGQCRVDATLDEQTRYVMVASTNVAQYIEAKLCISQRDGDLESQCRRLTYTKGVLTTEKPACPPSSFGGAVVEEMKKVLRNEFVECES